MNSEYFMIKSFRYRHVLFMTWSKHMLKTVDAKFESSNGGAQAKKNSAPETG
jgi:hypothetical protein